MTAAEWWAKNPNGTGSQCAAACGCGKRHANKVRQQIGIKRGEVSKTSTTATVKPAAVRGLSEFRAAYDKGFIVPSRVRAALKALGSGWAYEVEFAKLAGVGLADLATFREQFADYVVQIGRESRRAWAGTIATAKAMREML